MKPKPLDLEKFKKEIHEKLARKNIPEMTQANLSGMLLATKLIEQRLKLTKIDFEKLADEITRVFYPTYEKTRPEVSNAIRRKRNLVRMILEDAFKDILGDKK